MTKKYIRCQYCGKIIMFGEQAITIDGYIGFYCKSSCALEMFTNSSLKTVTDESCEEQLARVYMEQEVTK